ncbi:MAG: S-methyl-5'-thioadenosine phosphorylase [Anaerolineae bacterium]|nr:S-methyl-5'-thioadenosine phosphorylase [Anaerolineae bacterium]
MAEPIKIGIIGGSGLYALATGDSAGAEDDVQEAYAIRTPFGKPSDAIRIAEVAGSRVAFVARHGQGHRFSPTEVPYAANIYALKSLGVRFIIAVSACGSLRQDYAPGHICIPDQLVDFTREPRQRTFFGEGLVGHVGVGEPFSPALSAILVDAAEAAGARVQRGGTFVTVEGPRFSTRAESEMFRQLGFSIIGMTTSPEAFLAREAEIAYAVFAHITDYDVWHPEEADVSAASVMETFARNIQVARQAILEALPRIAAVQDEVWPAHTALQGALMTHPNRVPPETLDKLRPLVGRYLDSHS